jgi:3-deoxy-D-manno-octulosonic-acid transferase
MKAAVVLYNLLIIQPLRVLVLLYSRINSKLRERENAWESTLQTLTKLPQKSSPRVWFHAASMGEFEQAKPIIEHLKAIQPDIQVIVSFFSPSGFRHQKKYPFADAVVYMPLDTKANAREFINHIDPGVVIFIRYELWLNHLTLLSDRGIPTFLVCATFPGSAVWMYPPFRSILKAILRSFTTIYAISAQQTARYTGFSPMLSVQTSADTRFDRIISVVEQASSLDALLPHHYFAPDDFVLVLGSSWEKDEDILLESLRILAPKFPHLKLIIVPHEPTESHVSSLMKKLPSAQVLSRLSEQSPKGQHIITDSIGKLLRLYSVADAAYIGGGFGAGVHSTAEPAGYGIPVACGPFIERSPDAINLHQNGALEVIHTPEECVRWLETLLTSQDIYSQKSKLAKEYVYQGKGASTALAETIMQVISRKS